MSHLDLQPGFDFQRVGKQVLQTEREGLAQFAADAQTLMAQVPEDIFT